MLLAPDAVHPQLESIHDRLVNISEKRPGLLKDYSILGTYLRVQLDTLKHCDMLFAYDFGGGMSDVFPFIWKEMIELGQVLPLFNPIAAEVDGEASMEGGDVAWFLAMRVGIAHLDPENRSLTSDEENKIVGVLGILAALSVTYPAFDPEGVALEVAKKNIANYPSRVLRAHPQMGPHRMALEYDNVRLPVLKAFRNRLVDRKIPPIIYEAIQQANPEIPRVPQLKRGAIKLYKAVIPYAQAAGKYYNYPVAT